MINIKKNSSKKVSGKIGYLRFILALLGLIKWFIILIIPSYFITQFVGETLIINLLLLFLLLNVLGTSYFLITNKYYIQPLSYEKYKGMMDKNLIHYTNFISEEEIGQYEHSGEIRLYGNSKARANYSMKWRDSKKKYVWFHLSDINNEEPSIASFLSSHMTESIPRKFKVIIKMSDMNRNNLYIRNFDKAIIFKGDYYGKALVRKKFEWYNKKIYFKESLFDIDIKSFVLFIFVSIKQAGGNIKDMFSSI